MILTSRAHESWRTWRYREIHADVETFDFLHCTSSDAYKMTSGMHTDTYCTVGYLADARYLSYAETVRFYVSPKKALTDTRTRDVGPCES